MKQESTVTNSMTKPVQELVEATRAVADGNLDVHIESYSRDEIGMLVQSFNRMTEDLRSKQRDLNSSNQELSRINQEIEHLIDYLKNPPEEEEKPIDQKEIDIIKSSLANAPGLPDSARKRIDDLFKLAKKDLSSSLELKRELDKWNVYEQYEDSFLDLFKKPPKKNN